MEKEPYVFYEYGKYSFRMKDMTKEELEMACSLVEKMGVHPKYRGKNF